MSVEVGVRGHRTGQVGKSGEELTFPSNRINVFFILCSSHCGGLKKKKVEFSRTSLDILNQRGLINEIIPEYVPAKLHSWNYKNGMSLWKQHKQLKSLSTYFFSP